MKKIIVKKWKVKSPQGVEMEQTTLTLISGMLNTVWEKIPNGIDNFRSFKRISDAMDEAEKTGELLLEEKDHEKIKNIVEKNVPAIMGMSKDYYEAIDEFLK